MLKMCKNGKNWENGQNLVKKIKKFSIAHLKTMHLYFNNDERRPCGGPWECTNVKNPSDEFGPQCGLLEGGE